MTAYGASLAGGLLIGLSAALLLVLNGRVAGISGIVGRLAQGIQLPVNLAFVLGLICGPLIYRAAFGHWPEATITSSPALLMAGGLLVGFGSRMGSGCTSGHGVVGLARLSPRSMVAVATFLGAAIVIVGIMRAIGS
ncbi:YeeE/YedE family protein [Bradyrhizobium sp. U87765 SZCCT0131]|uniref:YeeE/YedE family protein n=1 Tax=unclassified Bradyrhizobium TaxID=2631580 RepID=UPI001BA67007|nr:MULTISPECIES: YeeE/YedE thiosulfate transporter family protein [unclassified Bradyrhizobium]MBR1218759.1 YeeE/YedE family protein [Bradyrhizobium sp. U87765 SZCCT0131]MBR1265482.1 YeeE/YedE family protein [Bradyrhizobium sp. U87765 SZCCT0134]MBR1304258.1 YeeE/YedE family protein [Bradyrhizobium sp. U87765 SZCCT0110]MBR1319863.1 YeeE/YedE family protein [Bradyrhizobium sp. U87765 SZCCT0109]MBR1348189.1 YeeE/YedE family protein [Bradyrhizobium sp. U87765 SZCCT0048]